MTRQRSFAALLALAGALASVPLLHAVAQVTAPGACAAIPAGTYVVHRTTRQSSPPDPEHPYESFTDLGLGPIELDLDGDGVLDRLVPTPVLGDCIADVHVTPYLVRGACGHALGTIVGRPELATGRSHGLGDLTTTVEETVQDDPRVPAVRRTHVRTYRFDGRVYREVGHTVRDAVCHHCALESCTHEPR